jgi:hypothetical protein
MITKNFNGKDIYFLNNISEIKLNTLSKYNDINNSDDELIDKIINIIYILSNASLEDIEALELTEAIDLFKELQITNNYDLSLSPTEFIHDGITYKVNDTYSIKQISLIGSEIKNNPNGYTPRLAAIIFREVLADGSLKLDYSDETLKFKTELFGEYMTYDYVIQHIINIANKFIENK